MKLTGKEITRREQNEHLRWENQLPHVYETLLVGFHAGLTVDQMFRKHLKLNAKIPDRIKNIKVGCFTPELFNDEEFKEFWKVEISPDELKDYPEVFKALNDPDIAEIFGNTGYQTDGAWTLEMIALMTQIQYLGFNGRMAELTNHNMHARFEKLQDPQVYKELCNSDFVKKYNLQGELPKSVPYFELVKKEFSVKKVESAIAKAHTRTGSPSYVAKSENVGDPKKLFFEKPNRFGVFAVNDLQRTTLQLTKSGETNPEIIRKNYKHIRNILAVAMMTGKMGMYLDDDGQSEFTDGVFYPSSSEAKDQMPTLMMKGKILHAGPMNTYLSLPEEVQFSVAPIRVNQETWDLYKAQRQYKEMKKGLAKGDTEGQQKIDNEIAYCENMRIALFEDCLPTEYIPIRRDYIENNKSIPVEKRKFPIDDKVMFAMQTHGIVSSINSVRDAAIKVAFNEFPEEPGLSEKSGKELHLHPFEHDVLDKRMKKALRGIIRYQTVEEENDWKAQMQAAVNNTLQPKLN